MQIQINLYLSFKKKYPLIYYCTYKKIKDYPLNTSNSFVNLVTIVLVSFSLLENSISALERSLANPIIWQTTLNYKKISKSQLNLICNIEPTFFLDNSIHIPIAMPFIGWISRISRMNFTGYDLFSNLKNPDLSTLVLISFL